MSKRHAIALMLAAVMATLLPVSIFSDSNDPASSVQGNETTASTSDPEKPMSAALGTSGGEDVNVEAMNSVGGYMVNVMNEQNKEKARNDALTVQEKYSIVTAEFDPESGVLYVGSTQPASCKIQARFLSDDDPKRESACVEATAEKGKDIVTTLNVDTNSLPEYYTIEIDLCFFTGNIKLCDTYVISDFTQQMQEIYATTIEDFEPEYVVNLDQNEDTNFMVLNENTIVADSTDTSNTLVSADYENGVFTFDNADETLSELKKDDYFYIQPNENDMIAVIVGDVMIEDNTVTITKSDSDQGDMFDFIKVEATPGMSDDEMVVEHLEDGVTVDDNQADEFMMSEDFVPIVGSSDETQARFYNLGPLTYHPAINLSLDMGFDKESGDENYELSGKLKGSVGISFGYGFNFYKSFSYISVDTGVDIKATTSVSAELEGRGDISLAKLGIPVLTVFKISFTPMVRIKVNASISVNFESEVYFGIRYDTDTDALTPFADTKSDVLLNVGGSFFIGIVFKAAFSDITEGIMEISFEPVAGVEVSGNFCPVPDIVAKNQVITCNNPTHDSIHGCLSCFDGKINLKAEGVVELKLLSLFNKKPALSATLFSFTKELGNFHVSDVEGFGWGDCPNKLYKVSFKVNCYDEESETSAPLENAAISLGGVSNKTNKSGIASFYCRSFFIDDECLGKVYQYSSTGDAKGSVLVKNTAKTVYLTLYKKADGSYSSSGNLSETAPVVTTVTTKATTVKTTPAVTYERQEQVAIESGELGKNRGSADAKEHIYYILYNDGNMFIYGSGEMDSFSRTPFRNTDKIKYVSIENTSKGKITNIGQNVFRDCVNLENIRYPSSVKTIDSYAFYNCPKLTTTYDLSNINSIGSYAFFGCESIIDLDISTNVSIINDHTFAGIGAESVALPESIISVNNYAFADCKKLKNITLPDVNEENKRSGVVSIGSNAFANCTALKELVIPEGVETMGTNMLNGCTNLETLTLPFASTSKAYSYNGSSDAYSQVSDLFINNWPEACNADLANYSIKKIIVTGGTHIPNCAFYQMRTLEEVVIPKSVTSIGANAFYQCSNLKDMKILDSVVLLGAHSFDGCSSLKVIPYGKNLKTIGDYAFANCTGLIGDEAAVEVPSTYTKIGAGAFSNCSNLQDISIPDTVTFIGDSAFENCTSLTELVIPRSVDTMGTSMLSGCVNLEKLTIPFASTSKTYENDGGNNAYSQVSDLFINTWPEACNAELQNYAIRTIEVTGGTYIPNSAFYQMSMIEEVILPETLTNIGVNAFYQCSSLTKIDIPATVVNIANSAFKESGLTSVVIPENCYTIGDSAFSSCENLKDITIPNSVRTINSNAFANCTALKELVIPEGVETMGTNMLNGCTNLETLTLPFASTSKAYSYNGSSDAYSQVSDLFINNWPEACSADLANYSIKKIIITSGAHIPNSAFYQMGTLEEVVIPECVNNIGANAFYQCANLKGMTIPDAVTGIGAHSFDGCSSLKVIPYGKNLKTIGNYAFANCTGLIGDDTAVEIPSTYTKIGVGAFSNCTNLQDISIPDTVTFIGGSAFESCTSLTELVIPRSVDTMGTSMLNGCVNLEKLTIPYASTSKTYEDDGGHDAYSQVSDLFINTWPEACNEELQNYAIRTIEITGGTHIPGSAFYQMSMLEEIILPETITNIDGDAFYQCSSLTKIDIPAAVVNIAKNAFKESGLTSVVIPENCYTIGESAFSDCDDLKSAAILNGVRTINSYAFANCTALTELSVPDSVGSMGTNMLNGSTNIKKLTIPFASTSKTYAYNGNSDAYSQVSDLFINNWPEACSKDLKDYAINTIIVTGGAHIPNNAFYQMDMLEEVYIPDTVINIDNNAFYQCDGLKKITIKNPNCNIPDSKDTIAEDAAIYGYSDSTAQNYADIHSREFVSIDNEVTTTTTTTATTTKTTTTTTKTTAKTTASSKTNTSTSTTPSKTTVGSTTSTNTITSGKSTTSSTTSTTATSTSSNTTSSKINTSTTTTKATTKPTETTTTKSMISTVTTAGPINTTTTDDTTTSSMTSTVTTAGPINTTSSETTDDTTTTTSITSTVTTAGPINTTSSETTDDITTTTSITSTVTTAGPINTTSSVTTDDTTTTSMTSTVTTAGPINTTSSETTTTATATTTSTSSTTKTSTTTITSASSSNSTTSTSISSSSTSTETTTTTSTTKATSTESTTTTTATTTMFTTETTIDTTTSTNAATTISSDITTTSTTTITIYTDVLAVYSEVAAIPNESNFYLSLDNREFKASDLFESIVLNITYEDGFSQTIDIINDVNFDGISPASLFEQSEHSGLYIGTVSPIYNGEELNTQAVVYVGVKGDANFDGVVTLEDATLILKYYAENSAHISSSFTGDAASEYEKVAFFLADTDTESKKGINNDLSNISISDASNILTYYAQEAAMMKPEWNLIIPSLTQIPESIWAYMANQ